MSPTGPRAIFFDLDNTLTSRATDTVAFAKLFAEDFSEQLQPIDFGDLSTILVDVDRGGYNPRRPEDLLERLVWQRAPSAEALEEHWQRRFAEAVLPRPGMVELLARLTAVGLKIGVVTNGGVSGQNRKIDQLGIRDRIQSLTISDAVGIKKPDSLIFELASRDLEVTATDSWFVGDHPTNDVLGAMRVGMTGVWIRDAESGHTWPATEPPPDFEIETLSEITGLLDAA